MISYACMKKLKLLEQNIQAESADTVNKNSAFDLHKN